MKEFHIISSGLSLITNAQRNGIFKDKKVADEDFWNEVLNNPQEINRLYNFLSENPKERSAELNTFLRVVEGKDPKNIEVYLFGTKTKSNEICRRVIEIYLKKRGFVIYTPYEVSGYFWEAQFDESFAKNEFQKGISELLDRLLHLAQRKLRDGYKVYFNPTGGLKAHVIATALAGFLVNAEMYYMNEEFNEVVFLPPLFYLPKGKEVDLLKIISENTVISGSEVNKICDEYGEEIERLVLYGLLELEKDEYNKPFRVKITARGKLFISEIKRLIR